MEFFSGKHAAVLVPQGLPEAFNNLKIGITTRQGGHSNVPYDGFNIGLHVGDTETTVIENRRMLAEMIGEPLDAFVFLEQVHGTTVEVVTQIDRGRGVYDLASAIPGVDGVITNETHLVLAAFYADCVPLYFFDPVTGFIGLAHAGWRGTVKGIVATMVKRLIEHGSSSRDIVMIIGPSIGKESYRVDEAVISEVALKYHNQCVEKISHTTSEYFLDLKALNKQLALDNGLQEENIFTSEIDTYLDSRMYSYRKASNTGRMCAYLVKVTENK